MAGTRFKSSLRFCPSRHSFRLIVDWPALIAQSFLAPPDSAVGGWPVAQVRVVIHRKLSDDYFTSVAPYCFRLNISTLLTMVTGAHGESSIMKTSRQDDEHVVLRTGPPCLFHMERRYRFDSSRHRMKLPVELQCMPLPCTRPASLHKSMRS